MNLRKHAILAAVLLLSAVGLIPASAQTVTPYPLPGNFAANTNFQVWINGQSSPVWRSQVGIKSGVRGVTSFAFTGSITVKVQYSSTITSAQILPTGYGIAYTQPAPNQIQFTLSDANSYKATRVVVRFNGDPLTDLYLFGDPPSTVPAGGVSLFAGAHVSSTLPYAVNVFEPGLHTFPGKYITLGSNQTIYLKPGAVINARVEAVSQTNIKILGPGVILAGHDTSSPNASPFPQMHNVVIYQTTNIELRDFILTRDFNIVGEHQLVVRNSDNVTINNYKALCDIENSDGLALGGNNYVRAQNLFLMSGDNNLVIGWWGNTNDVVIDNVVNYFMTAGQTSAIFFQGINAANIPAGVPQTSEINNLTVQNVYGINHKSLVAAVWGNVFDQITNTTIQNVYLDDVDQQYQLLYLTLPIKRGAITLKNVHAKTSKTGDIYKNYHITYDSVYLNQTLVTTRQQATINTNASDVGTLTIVGNPVYKYEAESAVVTGAQITNKTYASNAKAVTS